MYYNIEKSYISFALFVYFVCLQMYACLLWEFYQIKYVQTKLKVSSTLQSTKTEPAKGNNPVYLAYTIK